MGELRLRLGVVGVVVASLFAALFARLWFLQVVEQPHLAQEAERNLVRTVKIPAVRGRIFDRHGRVMVDNKLVWVVSVDKNELARSDRPGVLSRLSTLLGVPYLTLQQELDRDQVMPIEVARNVKESAVVFISEHPDRFPGVTVTDTTERTYPYTSLAAHLLGYVGAIRQDELDGQPKRLLYDENDVFGKSGIENTYEHELRGIPGREQLSVDRRGRIRDRLRITDPVPGQDLITSIDVDVQQLTEESLRQGLEAARLDRDPEKGKNFVAPAGSAVVLDTVDGSVVAMASYPTYDPEAFVGGISVALNRQLQDPASHAPLNNRAIQGLYAPGSTFKPFTAIAALANGLIGEYTPFLDQGKFKLPKCPESAKCVFRNAGEIEYGTVDVRRALTVSSDVFFYWLGQRFWEEQGRDPEGIQKVATAFGLGERTGIQLPSEHRGRIPDKETKAALHEAKPKAFPDGDWRTGDNVNTAIGQGEVVVTPLQLAVGYAAIANGGDVISPRVVLRSGHRNADGTSAATPGADATANAGDLVVSAATSGTGATAGAASKGAAVAAAVTPTPTTTPDGRPLQGPPAPSTTAPSTTLVADPGAPGPSTTLVAPVLGPDVRRHVVFPGEIRTPIIQGLLGVTGKEEGTAYEAFRGFPLEDFPIAGKTGTAQVFGKQDTAVFAACGPMPSARYVVAVIMEEAGFGGQSAAPVARRVFEGLAGLQPGDVRTAGGTRE